MRIAEILTRKGHDIFAVSVEATVAVAARVLQANDIGVVVVTTPEREPVGILSERDVVRALDALGPTLGATQVDRLMTRNLIVCHPDDDVSRAEDLMNRHRVRHLPVARDGKLVGVISIRDIMEVRQRALARANDGLRQGEASYRLLLSLGPDATFVVQSDGRIIYANRAAVQRFCSSSERTLIAVRIESLVHAESRSAFANHHAAGFRSGDAATPSEFRFLGADGVPFFGETIILPVPWSDQPSLLVSIRDISERKRNEAALREARDAADLANRTKSTFLANTSHELRTPLNAIIGFAEIIAQELYGPLPNEPYRQFATEILTSGRHLLAVINDVLDLSKVEAGKMELVEERIDVSETIEGSVRFLRHRAAARGVALAFPTDAPLPLLRADARKVKQILINLIANAVKFTPSGGKVTVSAEADTAAGVKISIADTGIGMSDNDIRTAFEAFGQAHRSDDPTVEGTGLGLPLSKSLVELHGGTLDIESAVGRGTTVTVKFPAGRIAA